MMAQIRLRTSLSHRGSALHRLRVGAVGPGLLGLLLAIGGCSSDASSSGAGGSSTGGGSAEGGKSSGGSSTAGSSAGGGAGDSGSSSGGSSSGSTSTGGEPSGGSASGGNASSAGIWGCVEAGGVCVCQNDTDKQHESVCAATYKCCVTVPFAGAIRCQCQDPGTAKCEAPAGSEAKVVDKCPPP
jgi:hypothetical protein